MVALRPRLANISGAPPNHCVRPADAGLTGEAARRGKVTAELAEARTRHVPTFARVSQRQSSWRRWSRWVTPR